MISFKSKITVKILDYFFLNPEARHYINELAKLLELDPKNLYRKLKELEKEGLFKSEFQGKERYFYLNKGFPLLEHYRQIFLKTYGIEQRLREIIKRTKGIKQAYIFGSYAKQKMDASSDIDILVVGAHSTLSLQKSIIGLQKDIGREINLINMSHKEFEQKKAKKDSFIGNIFKIKPIKLIENTEAP